MTRPDAHESSASARLRVTADRLAVCQEPLGPHEHVEVEGAAPSTCFADCSCAPALYVSLDAVLAVVDSHAVRKYDTADNVRRALIRKFVRGEAR